jgi:hypothetical protein
MPPRAHARAHARAHEFTVTNEADPARPSDAIPGGRRIQVRRSGVHGKGVFALRPNRRGRR